MKKNSTFADMKDKVIFILLVAALDILILLCFMGAVMGYTNLIEMFND